MLMEDWQDRVIAERTELSVKLTTLAGFISRRDTRFEALADEDKGLLKDQRDAMQEYIEILDARIARFTTGLVVWNQPYTASGYDGC